MAVLPGWDSLDGATAWGGRFHVLGYIALGCLFLFEVLAYVYDHRKDALLVDQQATVERQREEQQRQERENNAAVISGLQTQLEAAQRQGADFAQQLDQSNQKLSAVEQAQAPRKLTNTQIAEFVSYLKQFPPGRISVTGDISIPDAYPYTLQFVEALKEAGWDTVGGANRGMFKGPFSGIIISVHDRDNYPPQAKYLVDALKKIGIHAPASVDPAVSPDSILMAIGSK